MAANKFASVVDRVKFVRNAALKLPQSQSLTAFNQKASLRIDRQSLRRKIDAQSLPD
jgi:hypothetical protein